MCIRDSLAPLNAQQDVSWQSSHPSVANISKTGLLQVVGKAGESTTITATTNKGKMSDTAQITVSQWYEKPLEAIQLSAAKTNLITGDELTLSATFTPENPDDDQLKWISSAPQIATVDTKGNLHALTAGSVTVTAKAEANPSIQGSIDFDVQADVKPFIKIDNLAQLINQPVHAGDTFKVHVSYHAGPGHTVIAADEGGLRVWLRHFKYRWFPIEDRIETDRSVLYTVSGNSTATLSTQGLVPSDELPEGQFYSLEVSFTNSNGKTFEDAIEEFILIE